MFQRRINWLKTQGTIELDLKRARNPKPDSIADEITQLWLYLDDIEMDLREIKPFLEDDYKNAWPRVKVIWERKKTLGASKAIDYFMEFYKHRNRLPPDFLKLMGEEESIHRLKRWNKIWETAIDRNTSAWIYSKKVLERSKPSSNLVGSR